MEKRGLIAPCQREYTIRPEQAYKIYPARYIRTAHWSITGHCNYRCKHCYMSAPDAKFGELSHETMMAMVQQLIDCGVSGWHDWMRGIPGGGKIVEEAFERCKEKGFPTGAEKCIHQGNKHLLRETVKRLGEMGCRSLKTTPVSNVGAWKEGGYGESVSIDELYQMYLDYIPCYYEDGMPLSLQLGGFLSATPERPGEYDIPSVKHCGDPDKACVCGHARNGHVYFCGGPCAALHGSFRNGDSKGISLDTADWAGKMHFRFRIYAPD